MTDYFEYWIKYNNDDDFDYASVAGCYKHVYSVRNINIGNNKVQLVLEYTFEIVKEKGIGFFRC